MSPLSVLSRRLLVVSASLLVACNGELAAPCEVDADCGGQLSCFRARSTDTLGQCSFGCTDSDTCAQLHPNGFCTGSGGATGLCEIACDDDGQCPSGTQCAFRCALVD